MRTLLLALITAAMASVSARAQTPAAAQQPPAAAQPAPAAAQPLPAPGAAGQAKAAPTAELATPPEAYAYEPAGRRDPFLNLLGTGMDAQTMARHGDGTASMTVGEISVRGIMQSRGALIAMVEGSDKKTYVVHQGDKFRDGVIKSITPQGLIVIQEINDPLSLVKRREVRKLLRSIEDAK
jgi:Tfp pilus assembly protein PilP